MYEVIPSRLFVGNAFDARELKQLSHYKITALVDLAINERPAQPFREMVYVRVPIVDGNVSTNVLVDLAIDAVVRLLRNDFRVLVACSAGMSRAPAITAAAWSIVSGQPLEECLTKVVANRPHDVAPGLWQSICERHQELSGRGS